MEDLPYLFVSLKSMNNDTFIWQKKSWSSVITIRMKWRKLTLFQPITWIWLWNAMDQYLLVAFLGGYSHSFTFINSSYFDVNKPFFLRFFIHPPGPKIGFGSRCINRDPRTSQWLLGFVVEVIDVFSHWLCWLICM